MKPQQSWPPQVSAGNPWLFWDLAVCFRGSACAGIQYVEELFNVGETGGGVAPQGVCMCGDSVCGGVSQVGEREGGGFSSAIRVLWVFSLPHLSSLSSCFCQGIMRQRFAYVSVHMMLLSSPFVDLLLHNL